MKYQVNLDGDNYFSTLTSDTNYSHRVYAIDWSFLPDNKKFKMTFNFQTKARTVNGFNAGANIIRLRCSFEGKFQQNINGSNQASKQSNDFIGCVVIKRASNTTNDNHILTLPHHNPPTFLPSKPTGNFITVETINNTDIRNTGLTGSYLMTLFFEALD